MKYELIEARRTQNGLDYRLTVRPIPETFLESLRFPRIATYRGHDGIWYGTPSYQSCPDTLCQILSQFYQRAKAMPESELPPNPPRA